MQLVNLPGGGGNADKLPYAILADDAASRDGREDPIKLDAERSKLVDQPPRRGGAHLALARSAALPQRGADVKQDCPSAPPAEQRHRIKLDVASREDLPHVLSRHRRRGPGGEIAALAGKIRVPQQPNERLDPNFLPVAVHHARVGWPSHGTVEAAQLVQAEFGPRRLGRRQCAHPCLLQLGWRVAAARRHMSAMGTRETCSHDGANNNFLFPLAIPGAD